MSADKKPDVLLQCPKCGHYSGDSWGQCGGKCPVLFSPHYDYKTRKKYGPLKQVTQ